MLKRPAWLGGEGENTAKNKSRTAYGRILWDSSIQLGTWERVPGRLHEEKMSTGMLITVRVRLPYQGGTEVKCFPEGCRSAQSWPSRYDMNEFRRFGRGKFITVLCMLENPKARFGKKRKQP